MEKDKSILGINYVLVNEGEDCQRHPLRIILIVENIFKFLRLDDLKNARAVCNQWNDISSTFIQEKAVVMLDTKNKQECLHHFRNVQPGHIIFKNYQLTKWVIGDNYPHVREFWEKFGATMNSAEICLTVFLGADIFRNILFYWTPQLRSLQIQGCCFFDPHDKEMRNVLEKATETKVDIPVNRNMILFEFFGWDIHIRPPLTWDEIFIGFPLLKQMRLYNLTTTVTTEVLEAIAKRIQSVPGSLIVENLNIHNGDFELQSIATECLKWLTKLANITSTKDVLMDMEASDSIFHDDTVVYSRKYLSTSTCMGSYNLCLKRLQTHTGPFAVQMKISH